MAGAHEPSWTFSQRNAVCACPPCLGAHPHIRISPSKAPLQTWRASSFFYFFHEWSENGHTVIPVTFYEFTRNAYAKMGGNSHAQSGWYYNTLFALNLISPWRCYNVELPPGILSHLTLNYIVYRQRYGKNPHECDLTFPRFIRWASARHRPNCINSPTPLWCFTVSCQLCQHLG